LDYLTLRCGSDYLYLSGCGTEESFPHLFPSSIIKRLKLGPECYLAAIEVVSIADEYANISQHWEQDGSRFQYLYCRTLIECFKAASGGEVKEKTYKYWPNSRLANSMTTMPLKDRRIVGKIIERTNRAVKDIESP